MKSRIKPLPICLLMIFMVSITLFSCSKEEDEPDNSGNETAVMLQEMIDSHDIRNIILYLYYDGGGSDEYDYNLDYSFPGNNYIRLGSSYYNLEKLTAYTLDPVSTPWINENPYNLILEISM